MSATYAIYTSPHHPPVPDHLPTLIITPHGKPQQILYIYLHTNLNQENYLLTPSDQGDLCVAKLFPIKPRSANSQSSAMSHAAVKCEASRNLRWTIKNEGIQNPVYKLTLPNPDQPQLEQPLFQVSKPNPNSPWWTLFYFTYAGHLIPPRRIEFGKILKNQPNPRTGATGETKIIVTGGTEEEKAVWKTLGDGNEDMVEWILVCAALNVLDEEITQAAKAAGVKLANRSPLAAAPTNPQSTAPLSVANRALHPTGNKAQSNQQQAPIRPAVYHHPTAHGNRPPPRSSPNDPHARAAAHAQRPPLQTSPPRIPSHPAKQIPIVARPSPQMIPGRQPIQQPYHPASRTQSPLSQHSAHPTRSNTPVKTPSISSNSSSSHRAARNNLDFFHESDHLAYTSSNHVSPQKNRGPPPGGLRNMANANRPQQIVDSHHHHHHHHQQILQPQQSQTGW